MDLLSFLIPGRLVQSILSSNRELRKRLLAGVVFLLTSIFLLSFVSVFFVEEKMDARFALSGFEDLRLRLPTFPQMLMSRVVYVFVSVAVIIAIARLALYIARRSDTKMTAMVALTLSSLLIFSLVSAGAILIIAAQPKASYVIVDVELQGVKVYNGSFTGYTETGLMSVASPVITVNHLRAYRVYPDMKMIDWKVGSAEEVQRLIEQSKTVINMSNLSWVEDGVEKRLSTLNLANYAWSSIDYESYVNAVWVSTGPNIAALVFSLILPIGWGVTMLFIVRGFMKLYETSTSSAMILWIVMYVVFFFLGLL